MLKSENFFILLFNNKIFMNKREKFVICVLNLNCLHF